MRTLCYRSQRTLAGPAEVRGVGYLTGIDVRLRFLPAPPHSGVAFVRTDLRPVARIPALADQVSGTNGRTTLGHGPVQVSLIEHVLAALAGLRVDNCVVELDAPEPPGLDGSCRGFVDALVRAGFRRQDAPRPVWCVERLVVVAAGGATLALHPADGPGQVMTYFLDYGPGSPIARQSHTQPITPAAFVQRLAGSRTFILEPEVDALRRQGIGLKTTTRDLLVFGRRGPLGNRLRHANEPARHKVLDLVGDLSLLGADLCGHVVAYRSGHPLNVELVRRLRELMAPAAPCRRAA